MTDHKVRRVAGLVRSYLPQLVGDDAERYDRELADLLNSSREPRGQDDETTRALMAVLSRSPAVHRWAAAVLEDPRLLPPELTEAHERGYQELPSPGGEPVASERFRCPQEDYEWYRMSVGEPIAECPTPGHFEPLVRF
ncbi:hypothetical protein [Streptantibioticus ferralitis]|uniref:Uncharacterized protein n=1 Tax=Streptantibioticus ferralitis TaxID=236510 RepID=A0ABT5ZC29_9ACTN|nr:hypothetical protein [Streptantibioticus ferralitis]MDF2261397.1 hypothetical protein [Streptantibioticus ferralitis]